MELRARYLKNRKTQTILRFRFQTQRKFHQERGSFKRGANPRGMLVGSLKERVLTTMKWGIIPKITPNLNQGMGVLR